MKEEFEQMIDNRFDSLERMVQDLHDLTDERLSDIETFLGLVERLLYIHTKEEVSDER